MIKVPYQALSLKEAIYLLQSHEGYFDADEQALFLEE